LWDEARNGPPRATDDFRGMVRDLARRGQVMPTCGGGAHTPGQPESDDQSERTRKTLAALERARRRAGLPV
jgi:hypothetical protein